MKKRHNRPTKWKTEILNVDEAGAFYDNTPQSPPLIETVANIAIPPIPPILLQALRETNNNTQRSPEAINKSNIKDILHEMGLRADSNFFNIDVSDIIRMIHSIGNNHQEASKDDKEVLAKLKLGLASSIKYDKGGTLLINGFAKDQETAEWQDGTNGKIKTKDHIENEPLVCPVCETEYTDAKEILLAQTVSYHNMIIKISPSSTDDIKLFKPHIVLTPICPNCYCDQIENLSKDGFSTANVSPMFTLPDPDKHVVPLLPKCAFKKLDTTKNINATTNDNVFWPRANRDIICDHILAAKSIIDVLQTPAKE